MLIYACIVILIGLVAKLLFLAKEAGAWDEEDQQPENEVERALGHQLADQKFEETLQRVIEEKKASATNPQWLTPEHMLPEENLRRERDPWRPTMPGVVHRPDLED